MGNNDFILRVVFIRIVDIPYPLDDTDQRKNPEGEVNHEFVKPFMEFRLRFFHGSNLLPRFQFIWKVISCRSDSSILMDVPSVKNTAVTITTTRSAVSNPDVVLHFVAPFFPGSSFLAA